MSNTSVKSKLCSTMVSLLLIKPFHEISVKELIIEAGVNRTSFYYHFTGLEDVIKLITMEFARGMVNCNNPYPVLDDTKSINNTVYVCYKRLIDYYYSHQDIASAIVRSDLTSKVIEEYIRLFNRNMGAISLTYETSAEKYRTLTPGLMFDYIAFTSAKQCAAIYEYAVQTNFTIHQEEFTNLVFNAATIKYTDYKLIKAFRDN